MSTSEALLDPTQYVRVNVAYNSLTLQAHRDSVRIVFADAKPALTNTSFHTLKGGDPPLQVPSIDTHVWALAVTDTSSLIITETAARGNDYYVDVTLGNIPGSVAGFLIGINRNVNTTGETYVADQGGLDLDLPGNTQLYLSSSSAADTGVSVAISNIDDADVAETLTGTTNGQVQVATSAATSFKTQVMLVTGSTSPVGNIYLAEADTLNNGVPDDPSKIRAIIPLSVTAGGVLTGTGTPYASDNISHMGTVSVAADEQVLIHTIILGTNKNHDIKIQGRVRFAGGVWLNRNPIPVYQSNVPVVFEPPLLLPPGTDLKFFATAGSDESTAQVQAFFVRRKLVS